MTKQYCCLEHVELCMEKMIDAFEQAPQFFFGRGRIHSSPNLWILSKPSPIYCCKQLFGYKIWISFVDMWIIFVDKMCLYWG